MKRSILVSMSLLALAAGLSACGEKLQDAAAAKVPGPTVKRDTTPWSGDAVAHQAGTFTRGDKASWESALQARMQGQNENVRIGGGAAR
jgi:predicted small lipoprotein YifL